jgi:excisionase family DNA binding protein
MTQASHSTSLAPPLSKHEMSLAEVAVRALAPLTVEQRARVMQFSMARFGMTRRRANRFRPPDGLLTRAEAAAKLRISVKTLDEHVASGTLRYVALGHGRKRVRRMFSDADLDQFIANQTRKDVPCPPTASRARHTSTSISGSEVIGFTALLKRRRDAKPKK